MSLTSTPPSRRRVRRRFAAIGLAFAMAGAVGATAPAAQAAKPGLPTPTSVTVSNVTQRSLDVRIGGTTTKNYDVYVNGAVRLVNVPSSSTLPATVLYLTPDTTYSIQVRQRVNLTVSGLSAPVTARTLAGATVAPISNLRVVSIDKVGGVNTVTIAWDASPTPGAWYDISLNGVGNQSTNRTTAVVGESLNCYPGPCVGTGPKSGNNQITVVTSASIDGYQVNSVPVTINFNL